MSESKKNYQGILDAMTEEKSLRDIQKLREKMWYMMGFDDETAEQTLLLLVEEIGELAKATRKHIGMKCDTSKNNYTSIGEETADVLNLLLDFCTILGIDLFDAFKDKNTKQIDRVRKKGDEK